MTIPASGPPRSTPPADRVVRRLSPEDLSILALENETVAGHTCKVVVLAGELDPDRLRASIAARIDRAPELRLRLRSVDGDPCWTAAAALDLEAQVTVQDTVGPLDDAGLRATVAGLFKQRLDRSRPLWRMDLVPRLTDGRSALIWRLHHALADGATFMRIADAALWEQQHEVGTGAGYRPAPRSRPAGHSRRRGSAVLGTFAREAPRPWLRSPFDGHITAQRSVAFATAGLDGLRRAAAATDGATINDAVLTVVAGGLRRWLEAHHGHLGAVRVKVPVSLHGMQTSPGQDSREPGNHDSSFYLDLPLGSGDPVERLATIQRATGVRKRAHDAQRLDALMCELGRASPRLRRFAEETLAHPRSFAVNVSNVPGPRHPVQVVGLPVHSLHSVAEIRERHALRVAVVSLADALSFGLCADPTLLADVDQLAADMQAEAAVLTDHASS